MTQRLVGAAEVAGQHHGRVARAVVEQDVAGGVEQDAPALRDGIVEGDHEVALGRRADPLEDGLAGREQV